MTLREAVRVALVRAALSAFTAGVLAAVAVVAYAGFARPGSLAYLL